MCEEYEREQEYLKQFPLLTAAEARALLPNLTIENIRRYREKTGRVCTERPDFEELCLKVLYLGNLCARGDIDAIRRLLRETSPEEVEEIVNGTPYEQNHGNCLHMVLYWNTGSKAIELVELLLQYKASFLPNYHGDFPWENKGVVWISTITVDRQKPFLGRRNEAEFEPTLNYVRQKIMSYGVDVDKLHEAAQNALRDEEEPEEPEEEGWTTVSNKKKKKGGKK